MAGFIIEKIDFGSETFRKTFAKLDERVKKEARKTLSELILLDISKAPSKLHLHTLKDKEVKCAVDPKKKCAVYTVHLTSDDKVKASFTFEDGTAFMRVCGEHDWVDKNP
ncbi:hypothetical protein [Trinickia dinghuensis]|uniref:Uncharacterized protein n=1 Tax=Trinickia dinghuensis TaxID=2291023 RepID=A0A3D8JV06_9BURK|nr:hypothetical protein [Trinickia dinghuensis]RDU96963.1 hypothetical protein DWV00_20085 [Trinickia dinghuensis]